MTGTLDHERKPLLDTLTAYAQSGIYPFHTPGHKGGHCAAPEIAALVGKRGLALDLPAMTATDNTLHPTGCVREAQALAADLFGATETFFLSAGSTLGVATAMLSAVPPGQTIALPRNIHRSVVAGLVLSGAVPRFIPHNVLSECGALGVTVERLAETLDMEPRPAAVLLTRPSYYGLAGDLTEIVALCRSRQVPLIVDEAHGAHLHFVPPGGPVPALAAGADLVVQSCHKTLGSLVGSAQLHVGNRSPIDAMQVRDALNFLQSTSPSYLLLASLDATRHWLWREGRRLFATAVEETKRLEDEIETMPGLRVLRPENDSRLRGHRRDPLRVVVNVSGTGWTGYEVERFLRTEYRVEDEMADWFNVVYLFSPRDDLPARERLLAGLRAVSSSPRPRRGDSQFIDERLLQPPTPPLALAPREAALGRKKVVPLDQAAGQVCAEMVMFYPPGIPLLMPGERVTDDTLDVCRQLRSAGAHPYASDSSLATIRVVDH
ncbi:MAG: aminotransferase class I/II-fold pyridoxal phosphate-dependent enzyme [Planctomycetes bacterium]|nr:aminotransferase class I/II-fold pyridoxal phosphate-dependent enzyme [Planctomycetota bacterium]